MLPYRNGEIFLSRGDFLHQLMSRSEMIVISPQTLRAYGWNVPGSRFSFPPYQIHLCVSVFNNHFSNFYEQFPNFSGNRLKIGLALLFGGGLRVSNSCILRYQRPLPFGPSPAFLNSLNC